MNAKPNEKIDINEHRKHLNKLDLEIEKTLQGTSLPATPKSRIAKP